MRPGEKVHILMVDDHEENLLALEAVLADVGHRLVTATSGREALRRLLEEDFALVLMDVQMPGMDGFETAELIRQRPKSAQLPIIFLTAYERDAEKIERGYALGAVDYIVKPFIPTILRAKVEVLVELYRKSDQVRRLNETLERHTSDLEEANKALEAEIVERQRAEQNLTQANRELAAVNTELEAFSYSVSHDLRAPLRHINGFSAALDKGYRDKLDAGGQDALLRIQAAAQKMEQLIDDLLQLSRLTRGELHWGPVDLSALAQKIVAELRQAEPGRPIEFVCTDGLTVEGDARLLQVALQNLLANAWKFTGKQPAPRIEFGVIDQQGSPAYYIRDNGAGFDMAYAHKLFGAFQRLHSAEEFPGTGIGLATVQRVIHRHGGRVWAEGAVGTGATFSFSLPAAAPTQKGT